ncbi:MAG: 3-dehydroquinate synthase [Bacteroidales bacterium]|nr:3-dehydroquinate synthase [Bacteroidales bacterium]
MNALKSELKGYRQVFVVCDRNVEGFARNLLGKKMPLLAIDTSEEVKTIDTVMLICRWLLEQGADRDALVLAVGGGLTTDMAGFASCIYKRGIRYANVPTTLLSQVDAAIGGKTGVNLDGYKNLLGVIRQPEFTAIFPEVLETLPEREFRSGLAEMLKTFIIKNPGHAYERTVELFSSSGELAELIQIAAGIKQEIVEKDEFENGERRKLNLGHTWAHAIEWWQKKTGKASYTHGEAVAIGMVEAAKYSERLGIAEDPGLSERIRKDLKTCGLPTELPCRPEELLPAILKDKKAEEGKIRLVLPVRIGKVTVKKLKFEL